MISSMSRFFVIQVQRFNGRFRLQLDRGPAQQEHSYRSGLIDHPDQSKKEATWDILTYSPIPRGNESFAQPLFLVNSGHCEEQSDVAILWLINVLCDCFASLAMTILGGIKSLSLT